MRQRETEENGAIYWIIVIKIEKWDLSFVWVKPGIAALRRV